MKGLSTHAKRCLGALLALIQQHDGNPSFFSRNDIGRVVYGTWQGVHLKTMLSLRDQNLARPQVAEAVDLVADKTCSCGCDRWTVTDDGRAAILRWQVRVPELYKLDRRKPKVHSVGFGPDGYPNDENDPADWWKKGQP